MHGQWPGLAQLADGDLEMRQEFRDVLWEVLAARFPDLSGHRVSVFPGAVPRTIGAMTG